MCLWTVFNWSDLIKNSPKDQIAQFGLIPAGARLSAELLWEVFKIQKSPFFSVSGAA